jgi:hypothetical protein
LKGATRKVAGGCNFDQRLVSLRIAVISAQRVPIGHEDLIDVDRFDRRLFATVSLERNLNDLARVEIGQVCGKTFAPIEDRPRLRGEIKAKYSPFRFEPNGKCHENCCTISDQFRSKIINNFFYYIIYSFAARAQNQAAKWLWTYNNDRPNMAIGRIKPAMKLKMAA